MSRRHQQRCFSCLLVVAALGSRGALARDATVVVANAEAIVAAAPDAEIARDLLKALGESDLSFEQFRRANRGVEPQQLAAALVVLAAPGDVESYDAQNTRISVRPVEDFDRFVEAIDYGQVLRRDDASRTVRVKIDVEHVAIDRLLERAAKNPDPSPLAQQLVRSLDPDASPADTGIVGFGRLPIIDKVLGNDPEPGDRLGASFEPGDYAEVMLRNKPYVGKVESTEQGKFDRRFAELRIEDLTPFDRVLRDRRLRSRLKRAGELVIWVPFQRLRKLDGPPAPAPELRTWTDATAKFTVVATYAGMDGEKVRLKRENGKETKVPVAKLSAADRQYVEQLQAVAAASRNPFEDADAKPSRSRRADWSAVQEVRSRTFRRWEFNPPADDPPQPIEPAVSSLEVTRPDELGPFGEDLERLFVAANGSAAVVLLEAGPLSRRKLYLQFLDFRRGRSEPLIELPAKSVVLDVAPERRVVLMKEEGSGRDANTRLYIKRMVDGRLEDIVDWDAQPSDAFHKGLVDARVLAGGRIMTRTNLGPWVVWGAKSAKALYRFKLGNLSNDGVTLGPRRRFVIADADKAVVVIDTKTGEHVASLAHRMGSLNHVSVDAEMTRMALSKAGFTVGVDMTTGEVLHGVIGGVVGRGAVDFVGDLILTDHKYLLEPNHAIVLWQYQMASSPRESTHATVRAGRMWYAARHPGLGSRGEGPWAVASVATPHREINAMRAALGDLDQLVILRPGEEITVETDSDLDAATNERLVASVSKALTDSGYKVVEDDGREDLLRAVAICKRAERPFEVKVHDLKAQPPRVDLEEMKKWRGGGPPQDVAWWLKKRTVRPYASYVAIRRGDEYLWANGSAIQPGQIVSTLGNESVDQCVSRLSKPNVEGLERLSFPELLCRRGTATPDGAYGLSLLDADGIAENRVGE